jgi:hypothetical protein
VKEKMTSWASCANILSLDHMSENCEDYLKKK